MNDLVVQLFKGSGTQPWFLRLVSSNGRTLVVSEGYFSRFNAKRAAAKVFPDIPLREVAR